MEKKPTRYYSYLQEKQVCRLIDGEQTSNSGAGNFVKGDVVKKSASLLVECKTTTTEKNSVSIKKEWINKNKKEAFATRLQNQAIAFNFGPGEENYFVINERLFQFLVEKLEEEDKKDNRISYRLPEHTNMFDMCYCGSDCITPCGRKQTPTERIITCSDFGNSCKDYKAGK